MSRSQISDFVVDEVTENAYIREAYGKTLVELGKEYPELVVLDADHRVNQNKPLRKGIPKEILYDGRFRTGYDGNGGGFCPCRKNTFCKHVCRICYGACMGARKAVNRVSKSQRKDSRNPCWSYCGRRRSYTPGA